MNNKYLELILEQCNGVVNKEIPLLVLAPEYTEILLTYIEALQQRIDKARSILCDADSFIMKKEYVKANTRIIKAKEILGGKQ